MTGQATSGPRKEFFYFSDDGDLVALRYVDHVYLLVPMQGFVAQFLATLKDYPPRQKAAGFTVDQVMEQLNQSLGAKQ